MELIARALAIYFALWVLFRMAGKRALTTMTTFDFVLLLIIAEAIQQGLIGRDRSLTGAITIVGTWLFLDIGLSELKQRFGRIEKVIDGVPVVLIEQGRIHRDRLAKERVDETDILAAARERLGISRLDEIDYAILERNGGITVVPRRSTAA